MALMSSADERGTQSKLLALATEGRKVVGYGLQTREEIFNIDTSAAVNCVTFLSDVSLICGCQNSEMYAIDLRMSKYRLIKKYLDSQLIR